jgi:acetyltransferase-like isoleucine patch superfamily enzyme
MYKNFIYYTQGKKKYINIRGLFAAVIMLIRGSYSSMRLARIVVMQQGARIVNHSHIYGAGLLKLEAGCLLQGVSNQGVYCGRGVSFGAYSQVRPSSEYGGLLGEGCAIADGTTFGPYCYIGCAGYVSIGKNCMFGPRVSIIAENHVISSGSNSLKESGVTRIGVIIGNDCWIGAGVTILDGAIIEDGAIIGAGAIVKGRIGTNSIVAGVPAKLLRYR